MVSTKVVAIVLTAILVTVAVGPGPVNAQSAQDVVPGGPPAEKVRADVLKQGLGEKAQVEVKLRDESKLRGYIEGVKEDSFTVVDKNGLSQKFAYSDVQKVKKASSGFSTRSWIILGAAVAGAVATWIIVKPALCDGGAQTRGPC